MGVGSGRGDVDCGPVMDNGILLWRNRQEHIYFAS